MPAGVSPTLAVVIIGVATLSVALPSGPTFAADAPAKRVPAILVKPPSSPRDRSPSKPEKDKDKDKDKKDKVR
jgi:hypothetical protein